jgi:hypothetical protein
MGVGRSLALGALRSTFGECNDPGHGSRLADAVATLVPLLRTTGAAVSA